MPNLSAYCSDPQNARYRCKCAVTLRTIHYLDSRGDRPIGSDAKGASGSQETKRPNFMPPIRSKSASTPSKSRLMLINSICSTTNNSSILQLKQNWVGVRTIDECGMNFSKYAELEQDVPLFQLVIDTVWQKKPNWRN